jgi:RND family efflux transporter MFP subunit
VKIHTVAATDERNVRQFPATVRAARQADLSFRVAGTRAPFDGSIGARLVDNYEDVTPSQVIMRFQDDAQLDIVFNVPENLVRRIDPTTSDERFRRERSGGLGVVARFDGSDRRYPLTIKETSRAADQSTQTFRVAMAMPAPDDIQVLPGMTATVEVDLKRLFDDGTMTWIPSSGIVGDNALEPRVWVLNPDSMTVSARSVTVGRLEGDRIEVLEGLDPGDQVVITGAAYLAEGMTVARMTTSEQAEPRREDSGA